MKSFLLPLLCLPAILFAQPEKTVILAGSDFQGENDIQGAVSVEKILRQIHTAGYSNIDGVLFCGDYTVKLNNRPSESESGIAVLRQTLFSAKLGIEAHELILVQGNHDPVGTAGIAPSGNNDPSHKRYGVFVINEDDYMWFQGKRPTDGNNHVADDETSVRHTADKLDAYLSQKCEEKFSAPVFICSHLPLHYSMRTYHDGDARYAKYILDVINCHAKRGLKLFFLYGHNHSQGWDNYLGGGRVFFKPGEQIPIAVPANHKTWTREQLAFFYMNAGYTSYVSTTDPNDGADRTLSMSIFEIDSSGNVTVKRYSESGSCPLKAPGVPNTRDNNRERAIGLR